MAEHTLASYELVTGLFCAGDLNYIPYFGVHDFFGYNDTSSIHVSFVLKNRYVNNVIF